MTYSIVCTNLSGARWVNVSMASRPEAAAKEYCPSSLIRLVKTETVFNTLCFIYTNDHGWKISVYSDHGYLAKVLIDQIKDFNNDRKLNNMEGEYYTISIGTPPSS